MSILGPVFIVLSTIIGFAFYALPTMIAIGREHRHQKFIIATNLLAGWTVFVWLGCLIWASVPIEPRDE